MSLVSSLPHEKTCVCGAKMEPGYTSAYGLRGGINDIFDHEKSKLMFIVPPTDPTSMNPFKAFKQGLSGAEGEKTYRIYGYRCSSCGRLEFFAD